MVSGVKDEFRNMNVEKKPQLNSLQGLRVVAMFMIFMNHSFWLVQKGKFFDYGARGVEIFFVLAGFLVAYNYFDKVTDGTWNDCWCYLIHKFKKFYLLHILTMLLASYWSLHKIAIGGGQSRNL